MEEINDHEFVDLPIHRVKKKRVLSEKQQANWARALETRRKNIEMRKKAKEEISKMEKEQLLNDPDIKQRENRLRQLLMLMLSAEEKTRTPNEKVKTSDVEKVVIKRINENKENDKDDDDNDKDDDDNEEPKYIPKTLHSNGKRAKPTSIMKTMKNDSDDEESSISIFRD